MEVAPGVHRFGHRLVNWWAVVDGGRVTLVDAGLPASWGELPAALASAGRRLADVESVVLTHAHSDHTGVAERVRQAAGATVHVHRADAGLARGEQPWSQMISRVPRLLACFRSPGFLSNTVYFVRNGLLRPVPIRMLAQFGDGEQLDLPGGPQVVHVPGHTAGSCALLLEQSKVIFTGDALVTLDPYSNRTGPRLMSRVSNAHSGQALASLTALERLSATILLPGHGEPWIGSLTDAVATARRAGAA